MHALGELIEMQRNQPGLNLDKDVYEITKKVRSSGGFGFKVAGYLGDVLYYMGVAEM